MTPSLVGCWVALVSVAAPVVTATIASAPAPPAPEFAAMVAAARGIDALSRGDIDRAIEALRSAAQLAPRSGSVQRDLALALAQSDDLEGALEALEHAIALGDRSEDAARLQVMLLARLGRTREAEEVGFAASGWQDDLLGVTVGVSGAADRTAQYFSEPTFRGALAALVLAGLAGEEGRPTTARGLAEGAELAAERVGADRVLVASRALRDRLGQDRERFAAFARLRSTFDFLTNPRYDSQSELRQSGLRWTLLGEAAARMRVGIARVDAALLAEKHLFVTSREDLEAVELTGFALAMGFELPLVLRPTAASVGFTVRLRDVFSDLLSVHHAFAIEGGPLLKLPLDRRSRIELGLLGVSQDFIDVSPPDRSFSSQNRDVLGQRVRASFVWTRDWLDARVDLLFLRDDAEGDAFDSRGGSMAARLGADVGGGVSISTGASFTVREFGPVGDESVIGDASKRIESRVAFELGSRLAINDRTRLVFEYLYVATSARDGHGFPPLGIVSFGLEASL